MPQFCDKDDSDIDDDEEDEDFGLSDDKEGISGHLNEEDITTELREDVPIIEGLSDYSLASSYETFYPSDCDIDHRDDQMEFSYETA